MFPLEDQELDSVGDSRPRQGRDSVSPQGQRHDRMGQPTSKATIAIMNGSSGEEEVDAVDISAGQRMLSAVTGSLLTSILGKAPCSSSSPFQQSADMLILPSNPT